MSALDWPQILQPFDPFVTEKDTLLFGKTAKNEGRCRTCDELKLLPHAPNCFRFRYRLMQRHHMIAWFHLHAKHNLKPDDEAIQHIAWRYAVIEDLRRYDLFYPEMFKAKCAELRDEIDDAITYHSKFRHLDAGWDGRGWRPSSLAVIRECVTAIL